MSLAPLAAASAMRFTVLSTVPAKFSHSGSDWVTATRSFGASIAKSCLFYTEVLEQEEKETCGTREVRTVLFRELHHIY